MWAASVIYFPTETLYHHYEFYCPRGRGGGGHTTIGVNTGHNDEQRVHNTAPQPFDIGDFYDPFAELLIRGVDRIPRFLFSIRAYN